MEPMAMTGRGIMATDSAVMRESGEAAREPLESLIQLATGYCQGAVQPGRPQRDTLLSALDAANQMIPAHLRCANAIRGVLQSGGIDLGIPLYVRLVYEPAIPCGYQEMLATLRGTPVASKLRLKLNLVVADLWNFFDKAYLLYARRLLSDEPIDARELPSCEAMDGFKNAADLWHQLRQSVASDDRKLSVTREIVAQRFMEFRVHNASKLPRKLLAEAELETEKTVKIDYSIKTEEAIGRTSQEKKTVLDKLTTPDGVATLLTEWFSEWVESLNRASLEVRLFGDIAEFKRLLLDTTE